MGLLKVITYYILITALLLECNHNVKNANKDVKILENKIEKWVFQYNLTGNKAFLDSSYNYLTSQKYFANNRLNANNIDILYQVYFTTEKYDELVTLLRKSEGLKEDDKIYLLNLSNAYSNYQKGDREKGKEYIEKNIIMKQRQLQVNMWDSIAILDLYLMKSHLKSKENIYHEIDSLKETSDILSDMFFDKILKPEIKNQYETFPDFIR